MNLSNLFESEISVDAYHGTRAASFDAFSVDMQGSNTGTHVKGFHFTSNPVHASDYAKAGFGDNYDGGHVYPVRLTMKNPLVLDAKDRGRGFDIGNGRRKHLNHQDDAAAYARAMGHDGVVLRGWTDIRYQAFNDEQYIVFDPAQIRSRFE
jgi:hypothetical protein